jgi:dihydroflavonol-4-reductase
MGIHLVTGGTGLIGHHLVRALLERGEEVRVTLRPDSPHEPLEGLDVSSVLADVGDRRAIRRAMKGVSHVYHVAGVTSLRATREDYFRVNVEGTRVVMGEALRAGVEKAVLTSSVSALGPAPAGVTADETQIDGLRGMNLAYPESKLEAEVQALRLAAQGLPLVIVMPGQTFGRGDWRRSSTEVVRRFLRRDIPAYVEGTLCVVDARDVAQGHILAAEKGAIGERYILGGRNFTLTRLFADLGRISGVEPPSVKLPVAVAQQLAAAAERLPGRPIVTSTEILLASQRWAYRSTRAKRDLGWTQTPHEETLENTVAWWREREGDGLAAPGSRQNIGLRLLGGVTRRTESAVRIVRP